jgi:Family of unknown function (DUF6510)
MDDDLPPHDSPADDRALDGNTAGGPLSEVFAFDITVARTTCASCRDTHAVAELMAYLQAPGIVLRCASCGAVQLRHVRSARGAWLDLRGVEVLQIPAG